LAAILSLRFTPLGEGGKLVFTLRKDFSGVLRIGEVDLDGAPAISVLPPPPVSDKPCKTDLSGLMVFADFSALCWDIVLEDDLSALLILCK
jgi:hypothetical protein